MPLTAKSVSHVYRRGEPAETRGLDDVSLSVAPGEIVLISGANGSGKSTLLHCLSGLLKPTRGSVAADGPVALSIQFPERALFADTVFDDVAFGPRNSGLKKDEVKERALDAIKRTGLDESLLVLRPRALSHGQRRLAAIAGVIAMHPRVLLLDEPTAGLDPAAKERIVEVLASLSRDGMAVVVASHDLAHFMGVCSRMLVVDKGKIVFDGTPGSLMLRDDLDLSGLALPPSFIMARWLRKRGIEAAWDIGPEAAAEHYRRAYANTRMD